MHFFIIADGKGERWGEYRGTPKHLAIVEGEKLLERTVGQFSHFGQVIVVGPDARYLVDGANLYRPQHNPSIQENHEADRFYCHMKIWPEGERVVLLFGDVWFSERAVEKIVNCRDPWAWFCRMGPSKYHGCPYGEGFGFTIAPEEQTRFKNAVENLIAMKDLGLAHKNQGWQVYRYLALEDQRTPITGRLLRKHEDYGYRVDIDDWTDDFDKPEDLIRWETRRLAAGYPKY